ncbi:RHS repeat-associated core domain-containing protein [Pseudomonas syringae]|uniref:RHS repeat-associated core domain-containing protein n=1 Tax=Pseudomonas syringae TaxID=317 RepID=UPI00215658FB|nr:RHS repeat-associated core domain-containing protein [Pseudomonas syringae]
MISTDQTVLCTYRYDPLDRLASSSPVGLADIRRFYQKNRLATEIQGALQRTVFQHEDLLLAQQRHVDGVVNTMLLATDQQRSVLRLVDKSGIEPVAYSAYGHHPAESGLTSLLGFNGERRDPVTGHYLLGNGYRAYNPVLMRFNSPDSLSPFDEGGLNAYGYCGGDPVGFVDETGHGKFKVISEMAERVLNRARPIEIVRAPPIKIKTPLSKLSEMVDRLPAISSSPSPIASSSAVNSSSGIGSSKGRRLAQSDAIVSEIAMPSKGSGTSIFSKAKERVAGIDGKKNLGSPGVSIGLAKRKAAGVMSDLYKNNEYVGKLRKESLEASRLARAHAREPDFELYKIDSINKKTAYLTVHVENLKALRGSEYFDSKTYYSIRHRLKKLKRL